MKINGVRLSPALYNPGRMYETSRGVRRDLATAMELYWKAASRGNSHARKRIDRLTRK